MYLIPTYFLLRSLQHKCRTIVPAGVHLPTEVQTVSDIDFYIDGVLSFFVGHTCAWSNDSLSLQDMIHIADTKVARRYGDYFLRQINKLQDVNQTLSH